MKKINIAILGFGVVGGGTYDLLKTNRELLKRNQKLDIEVKHIFVRDPAKAEAAGAPKELLTTDLDKILKDKSIKIVVELIGGVVPAKDYILRALQAKKSVVTANKELLSKEWPDLERAAWQNKVGLYFEASCVGGVPIIRTLNESMQGNNVQQIMGIINGTTNYILTKMTDEGTSYSDALSQAQDLGFAEADPTADVEGFDAMYKLSILASLAFHAPVPYDLIYREGISAISKKDIAMAKDLGYNIKLLGMATHIGKNIEARVHPVFVPHEHPLANVRGSFNAVFLKGDYSGDIMLYGRGAGAKPTASAVVSDICLCAFAKIHRYTSFSNNGKLLKSTKLITDFKSKYYLSIDALDEVGVLAKVAYILGKNNVSLHSIVQSASKGDSATVVFMTHETNEKAMQNAIKQLKASESVKKINNLIRVI